LLGQVLEHGLQLLTNFFPSKMLLEAVFLALLVSASFLETKSGRLGTVTVYVTAQISSAYSVVSLVFFSEKTLASCCCRLLNLHSQVPRFYSLTEPCLCGVDNSREGISQILLRWDPPDKQGVAFSYIYLNTFYI
jgi:hypothetical protein